MGKISFGLMNCGQLELLLFQTFRLYCERHLLWNSYDNDSFAEDCITGETWYEKCRKCTCKTNRKPLCIIADCNSIAVCPAKMIWINKRKRCYCGRALQHSICVELKFQRGEGNCLKLQGHPCKPESFVYDSCTMCICQEGKTACVAFENCFHPKGGICNEGEDIIDNCFKCTCTHTRFLRCSFIEKCWLKESKPGKCPPRKKVLYDYSCIIGIEQECRYDYGCPDGQKCCQVSNCSFRCQRVVVD